MTETKYCQNYECSRELLQENYPTITGLKWESKKYCSDYCKGRARYLKKAHQSMQEGDDNH